MNPDFLKRQVGKTLLAFCNRFPRTKPRLRPLGLRTRKEWFGRRAVRVQMPEGRSFRLASVSRNYLSFELFWRGTEYYEPITTLVLQELVGAGDTFIDVGANIGFYSLVLSVSRPGLQVVAFEPNPKAHELLKANAAANDLRQICCAPLAISDTTGTARLHLSASDMSASLRRDFDFHPADTVAVRTTTLDDYLRHAETRGRLVIKVDVEGHEAAFFRGARRTLASRQPDIVAEVAVGYGDDTLALLRGAGYRFFPITDRGLCESGTLVPVVREPFVFLNYLLTCKPAGEVAALFDRIRERVARIDLKQTSKCLDAASLREFQAREGRRHPSRPGAGSGRAAGNQYTGTLPAATSSNETTAMSGSSAR
jgi:FkbM family methyltransferase